ncbi:MAG: IS5/IS1182 family transposase, partial [Acetobacteraceae bacterium]|nr:IS5/IS1182 family transposase [Acetobacteraceae bacterium]
KNDTHASTTDPDCRLYRKSNGRGAKLAYMAHVVMENRHGLAVAGMVTEASGTAERNASEEMLGGCASKSGIASRQANTRLMTAPSTSPHCARPA